MYKMYQFVQFYREFTCLVSVCVCATVNAVAMTSVMLLVNGFFGTSLAYVCAPSSVDVFSQCCCVCATEYAATMTSVKFLAKGFLGMSLAVS